MLQNLVVINIRGAMVNGVSSCAGKYETTDNFNYVTVSKAMKIKEIFIFLGVKMLAVLW